MKEENLVVRKASQVPPGRPGTPLLGQVGINRHQACCKTNTVAFMAGLSHNVQGLNQALLFDDVIANEGGAYRPASGSFVAPAGGLYVFHVHVLRCRSSGCLYIHLMKNNEIISSGTNQDNRFETTSTSAVMALRRNDVVWVRLRQGIAYGHTAHYTSFSGFSLRLDQTVETALEFQGRQQIASLSNTRYLTEKATPILNSHRG